MTPFIDTNIFLRFLIPDKVTPSLSRKARSIFHKIQIGELEVQANSLVVAEIVYILEGFYNMSKSEISSKLSKLLPLKGIKLKDKDTNIRALSFYQKFNLDFEDAYIYAQMQDEGSDEIYTFDKKHFKKFKDIKVLP